MSAITDFAAGTRYALRGLLLLKQSGIWPYALMPLTINALLFGTVIWFGAGMFTSALDTLLPAWLDWLRWLLWPIFAVTVLAAVFFSFTLLASLLASPFNGLLAQHVETRLTGTPPESGRGLMGDMAAGAGGALHMLGYVALRGLPLVVVTVIPVVNLAAPILWFVFGAWLLTIGYADAPSGNHGHGLRDLRRRLEGNRALALGFGSAMTLITLIPGVNFVAVPTGVAGATLLWVERLQGSR